MEQEVLIYIDDKEKYDASVAANSFADSNVRNRAYFNNLGAELAIKYLKSENISTDNIKNIHSVKKILEHFDISDVMLENIHIDVRVVFDENAIFIPKSHFEFDIVPDIYLVLLPEKDFSKVRLLGFFEPKLINKNNANDEYYFIEKEKLSPAVDLINYINSHENDKETPLSENIIEDAKRIMISMADNDVSTEEQKYLLTQLTASKELRDLYIEYENFETLSYKAANDPSVEKPVLEADTVVPAFIDEFEEFDEDSFENLAENDEDTSINEEIIENLEENDEDLSTNEEGFENFEEDDEESDEALPIDEETFTDIDNLEIDDSAIEENIISLDDISAEPLDDVQETVSQDDIDEIEPLEQEKEEEENISLENIEMPEEETLEIDEPETINLDNISEEFTEEEETEEKETPQNVEPLDISTIEETPEEEIEEEIPDDISLENNETPEYSDKFGKNLLENLSAEELNNISPEENDFEDYAQDISSDDLLSQIDNALNFSIEKDENTENPEDNNDEIDVPRDYVEELLNSDSDEMITEDSDGLNVLFETGDIQQEPISSLDDALQETQEIEEIMPEEISEEIPQEEISEEETLHEENPQEDIPQVEQPTVVKNNKTLPVIIAASLACVLAAGAAFFFLKPKEDIDSNTPIQENTPPQTTENILENNVPEDVKPVAETKQETIKEIKNNPTKPIATNSSYLSVSKIVWDVPNDLSNSTKFQEYLNKAGKSIRLSLTADLLLADEYAYTNHVKVGLTLNQEGSIQDTKVISGSGSSQIDNIVLQSVKDTLNVIKPPRDNIKSSNFKLNLTIYF